MKADDYRYILTELVEKIAEGAAMAEGGDAYAEGRRMAYFEILDAISILAEDVGVGGDAIGLDKVDKDAIIGLKKVA